MLTPVYVVLGMHRGGTSTVSRGLMALGVSLGENLWGPKSDNERGFWEDRDVQALNEELIAELGETWHSVRLFDPRTMSPARLEELLAKGRALLADKLKDNATYGFKDPRTSRLLFYWRQVFAALSVEPRYVIATRNPISVARSLLERNGLPGERCYLLWMEHMLLALHGTEGCRRIVVDYDLLLQDPAREMRRVGEALRMPRPQDMVNLLADYSANFLSEKLRHTQFDAEAVSHAPGMPGCAVRLHRLLTELAADRISPDAAECRDEVRRLRNGMNDLSTALSLAEQGYREAATLYVMVAERDARINELLAASSAQAARIADLERALGDEAGRAPGKAPNSDLR